MALHFTTFFDWPTYLLLAVGTGPNQISPIVDRFSGFAEKGPIDEEQTSASGVISSVIFERFRPSRGETVGRLKSAANYLIAPNWAKGDFNWAKSEEFKI